MENKPLKSLETSLEQNCNMFGNILIRHETTIRWLGGGPQEFGPSIAFTLICSNAISRNSCPFAETSHEEAFHIKLLRPDLGARLGA